VGLSTVDQLEILQLLYRYGHALDSGDAEGFAELFADDGVFEEPERSVVGHDALVDLVVSHHRVHAAARNSQHWLQSPVITGDGGSAHVEAYVIVFRPSGRAGAEPFVMGSYRDELRRLPGRGWVFQHRVVRRPSTSGESPAALGQS